VVEAESATSAPLPPEPLRARVGGFVTPEDFDDFGRRSAAGIEALLPERWTFEGKRVLDFGCGAGRTLRHFVCAGEVAEFHGCEIDAASVAWLERHLSPPFRVALVGEAPPLPYQTSFFDLVYAVSVFTHLTDLWSAWLLDLHRVLRPDGLLIATFLGPGGPHGIAGVEWSEDGTGMNVLRPGQGWERGGPTVLHSEWWIRAHWGRAFEVRELSRSGFGYPDDRALGQGVVVLAPRAVELSPIELEAPEPGETRELVALRENLRQLQLESRSFRDAHQAAAEERDGLRRAVQAYENSWSWRVTSPLRSLRRFVRR